MALERIILWHRWFPPKREAAEHAAIATWTRAVTARLQVAGGTLLGTVGASSVAAFDPADVVDVIDVTLDLLDEAEEMALEIAFALALGPVEEQDGPGVVGAVIERAQLLANRARAGEVVLDATCREAAADGFLFGRQVGAGAGVARGTTIDRQHPRRAGCADAIAELGPAVLPPVIASVRDAIEADIGKDRARTFVLRGPVGAGASELIADLENRANQGRTWKIGASPGGIVPLASLRLALLRRLGTPLRVRQTLEREGHEPGPSRMLARVAAGELVSLDDLCTALEVLLASGKKAERRPWVVLSPLSLVDGATLAALLEVRKRGGDFVLFGRYPVENELPRPLGELSGEPVRELTLPPLKMSDARVVSEAVLGSRTPDDVARRVAVLGGDTVLGIVEAARTLIATGELVRHADRFVWRSGPRDGSPAIGPEALLTERLELLDEESRRVLEALCVVPDGSSRELVTGVVAHDSIAKERFERSLDRLQREALAHGRERPRPISSLLRWRVLSLIPPQRSAELHRFVGEALRQEAQSVHGDPGALPAPLRVEIGYFLAAGGRKAEGRALLTEALEPLVHGGYERAARQLSGWLAAFDQRLSGKEEGSASRLPPLEAHEEPPPSVQISLDELLEDAAERTSPRPTAPPPPARLPPPPPRRRSSSDPKSSAPSPPEPHLGGPPPTATSNVPPPSEPVAQSSPAAAIPAEKAAENTPSTDQLSPPPASAAGRPPPIPAHARSKTRTSEAPERVAPPRADVAPPSRQGSVASAGNIAASIEDALSELGELAQGSDALVNDFSELAPRSNGADPVAHDSSPAGGPQPRPRLVLDDEPMLASSPAPARVDDPRDALEDAFDALIAEDQTLDPFVSPQPVSKVEDLDTQELGPPLLDEEEARAPAAHLPPTQGTTRTNVAAALNGAIDALLGESERLASTSIEGAFDDLLTRGGGNSGRELRYANDSEELRSEPTRISAAPMRPFVEKAVRAIRARDFAELEHAIQRAIAEGSDLGAVGRIRAIADLARGDLDAARRNLRGAQKVGRVDRAAQARYRLAEALLDLHAGELVAGIRAGLAALAASRDLGDARGEAAALRTLAACYRALGREREATRLEAAR